MKNLRKTHLFCTVVILLAAISIAVPFSAFTRTNAAPPIYQGITKENVNMVQAAIASGADVNGVYNEDTMLCYAIERGAWDCVRLLIQSPRIDVSKRGVRFRMKEGEESRYERTPLILAAFKDQNEIALLLLKKGADVNARTRNNGSPLSIGFSALMIAADRNNLDMVKLLLANRTKPNVFFQDRDGETAFWYAVVKQNIEMVKLLHSAGSHINAINRSGGSLLTETVMHKNHAVFDYLVANRANINYVEKMTGYTLLMNAIQFRRRGEATVTKFLEKLLSLKPNLNHVSMSDAALHLAVRIGYFDAVRLLLDNKANINIAHRETGGSPLHSAVLAKNAEMIKYLVKRGANTEHRSKTGTTPLVTAVSWSNIDLVRALVEGGAVINMANPVMVHITPLIFAASIINPYKHDDCIAIMNYLLDKNGDVNFPSVNGTTALMASSALRDHSIALKNAALLVSRGAKLNLKNKEGNTALMLAVSGANDKLVHFLVSKGADINLKNSTGKTALDFAKLYGREAISRFLESRGARIGTYTGSAVTAKFLIGTWEGYVNGQPQVIYKWIFNANTSFHFQYGHSPAILRNYPRGVRQEIGSQIGTFTVNGDMLILSAAGKAPLTLKWKMENGFLIISNARLRKIR